MPRLPTGIDVLDQMLLGGVPPGSIVALIGAPASQSELLLSELAIRREAIYLTTERSADAVSDVLHARDAMSSTTVVQVDDSDIDASLDRVLGSLPMETILIVDSANALERLDHRSYVRLLQRLKARIVETDSVALLHCLDGAYQPQERDTTLYHADVVFALSTRITDEEIENRLAVPKFRGNRALNDTIKLDLGDRVVVDTSRNIS